MAKSFRLPPNGNEQNKRRLTAACSPRRAEREREKIGPSLARRRGAERRKRGRPTAAEAIKDAAAQSGSGPFTIYAFSGGAQVTQSALALLGPAIAARAAQPGDGQMGVNRYPTLYQGKPELLALARRKWPFSAAGRVFGDSTENLQ